MSERQTKRLPVSELGDDRNFHIDYFGHGDIFLASWRGDVGHRPVNGDGIASCFNMAHGSEVVFLAALEGFLHRARVSDPEIHHVFTEAGADIISDADDYPERGTRQLSVNRTANGDPITMFDLEGEGLEALDCPIPNQPGTIERVGGTGLYTRRVADETRLVIAGIRKVTGVYTLDDTRKAEFCVKDVPTMATMVCEMAVGEYRRDIWDFLNVRFIDGEEDGW